MTEFIPGQRCISDAELQMGLGTVLTVEARTLTVLFMATARPAPMHNRPPRSPACCFPPAIISSAMMMW